MNKLLLSTAIATFLVGSISHAKSTAFEQNQHLQAVRSGATAITSNDNPEASNVIMRHHRHHHRRRK